MKVECTKSVTQCVVESARSRKKRGPVSVLRGRIWGVCDRATGFSAQKRARSAALGADSITKFGQNRFDQVTFPTQKVHLYDTIQRHRGKKLFFAHPDASQPLLTFDGSVNERKTRDANLGWQPNFPDRGPSTIVYAPYQYEPPTSNGMPTESFPGRYRWTRGGLKGVDFGGSEVFNVR